MIARYFVTTIIMLLPGAMRIPAQKQIAQSLTVDFPANGSVIVQARERIGRFPEIRLVSKQSGKVLLRRTIADGEGWLKPRANAGQDVQPFLRFRVVRPKGLAGPCILAVAVRPGGSDNAFYGILISEIQGRLSVLTRSPAFTNIQGGFYFGRLSEKLGLGFASWNFVWGADEAHYAKHRYRVEIFCLQDGRLVKTKTHLSRRRYSGNGVASLRELGIFAMDQRVGIPDVKGYLE
ncbi:MAG TPA: hypothetical protein VLM38_11015 [Blastocatellia bacterium]|nr:hypothetical protein [Blastocatellia bacterium]